jgi:hypothetical protein
MLRKTPPAAPATATSSPSAKYCAASCPRPAPSATRIAVSRARATARASSSPAAFAQVIRNNRPAAAKSSRSVGRTSLMTVSRRSTSRAE